MENNNRIIHIGLHKTATSLLQRQYFSKLENLTFQNSKDFYLRFGKEELHEKLLISSEALSGLPWNEKWKRGIPNNYQYRESFKRAIENLNRLYPDSHIIVVFRKHGDFLFSLYKQYIQEGGVLTFNEFYNEKGVIRDEDLNLSFRIKYIKRFFKEVDVLSFENFKRDGIAYFDSYFDSLGYQRKGVIRKNRANQSISGKKIEILRFINKFYPRIPGRIQNLLSKNHITPRKILQARMRFWKSKDPDRIKIIQQKVNQKFKEDWAAVEEQQWKAPNP